ANAGVAGEFGGAGVASVAGAGRRCYAADGYGVRPRPWAASEYCALLPSRAVAARNLRSLRAAEFPQDFGLEGAPDLRAAEYAGHLRRDEDVCARAGAVA